MGRFFGVNPSALGWYLNWDMPGACCKVRVSQKSHSNSPPSWYVNSPSEGARAVLIIYCESQARRYDSKFGGLQFGKVVKFSIRSYNHLLAGRYVSSHMLIY